MLVLGDCGVVPCCAATLFPPTFTVHLAVSQLTASIDSYLYNM
jgi:hypothetical protein